MRRMLRTVCPLHVVVRACTKNGLSADSQCLSPKNGLSTFPAVVVFFCFFRYQSRTDDRCVFSHMITTTASRFQQQKPHTGTKMPPFFVCLCTQASGKNHLERQGNCFTFFSLNLLSTKNKTTEHGSNNDFECLIHGNLLYNWSSLK
jgi:hypothetical protein